MNIGVHVSLSLLETIIDGMKCYTAAELEAALRNAGFLEVRAEHHGKKPWITVLAKK